MPIYDIYENLVLKKRTKVTKANWEISLKNHGNEVQFVCTLSEFKEVMPNTQKNIWKCC